MRPPHGCIRVSCVRGDVRSSSTRRLPVACWASLSCGRPRRLRRRPTRAAAGSMGQASTATCRPTLPRINRLPGCCRRAPSHCHERRGEGRSRVAQSGSSQRGEACKASRKLAITNQHAPAQSQRRSRPRVLRPVAGSNELSSGADAGEEASARSRHCARARANAEFEPRRACH